MQETVGTRPVESTLALGATRQRLERVAGLSFFLLAAQFMVVIMLGAAMVPGYDFNAAAISDLGVFPETALLFNASLVVVGLATIGGGYAFYRSHERVWLFALFVMGGLGAILAGVFTLASSPGLHGIGALLAFLFFNLQALGSARLVRGPIRWLSLALGLLGLAFVVLMVIGDAGNPAVFGPIGHGGAERMIVYPPMLWLLVFGGALLGTGTAAGSSAGGQ
jgi:hypothetical membrane protein